MPDKGKVESLALAQRIAELMEEKKAEDTVVLDMRGVVSYTDFFVICNGRNERQVKAIHDSVYEGMKHGGEKVVPARVEGLEQSRWVLLDYFDVVVHIFLPEARDFYRLERLWGEVPKIESAAR